MADDKAQGSQAFWTSMPGIMTALAGIITASAGLLTVLKSSDKPPAPAPTPVPAPSPDGPVVKPVVAGALNDFDVVSFTPGAAAPLPLGRPVEVAVSVRYKLSTLSKATFGVYLDEYPPGDATCSGNVHHSVVSKLMSVTSPAGTFNLALKWQRKAGDTYKNGGPADHGFLSVGGNLWQDATGRAGTLLQAFGNRPAICVPYG